MPGSCEEPFAPHHYREVLINKDNTQDNTLPRTDEFQNWYSRQRRELSRIQKKRKTPRDSSVHGNISTRPFQRKPHFSMCAPHVSGENQLGNSVPGVCYLGHPSSYGTWYIANHFFVEAVGRGLYIQSSWRVLTLLDRFD